MFPEFCCLNRVTRAILILVPHLFLFQIHILQILLMNGILRLKRVWSIGLSDWLSLPCTPLYPPLHVSFTLSKMVLNCQSFCLHLLNSGSSGYVPTPSFLIYLSAFLPNPSINIFLALLDHSLICICSLFLLCVLIRCWLSTCFLDTGERQTGKAEGSCRKETNEKPRTERSGLSQGELEVGKEGRVGP